MKNLWTTLWNRSVQEKFFLGYVLHLYSPPDCWEHSEPPFFKYQKKAGILTPMVIGKKINVLTLSAERQASEPLSKKWT